MRLVRISATIITLATLAALLVSAPLAYGAPSADGQLQNPGFESGFTKSSVEPGWNGVPNGWTPWFHEKNEGHCDTEPSDAWFKPNFEEEMHPTHVHGGISSARMWVGYHVMDGGLYQTVAATAGSTYQFSAYANQWTTNDPIVDTPSDGNTTFQVGIDPAGGTSPAGAKWSGGSSTMDTFVQESASAVATGASITVFLRSTSSYCVARNDVFFDDASLAATATGPAPTSASNPGKPPTPKPPSNWGVPAGSIVTATPQADGSIVHTVHSGESCDGIAVTYGVTRQDILKLNNLSSCSIISVGQKLIIKPAGSVSPGGSDTSGGTTGGDTADGGATQEATEAATAPEVAAAQTTGTICVMGYDDKNGNGIREPAESKLAGMTFTVSAATGPVANYTTDGVAEPHCFAQLEPGSYTVKWDGGGLTPSGDQTWSVNLTAGSTASREFGAMSGTDSATGGTGTKGAVDSGGSTGLPTWAIALIGAFGVILFMGGLGVAGYFLLLRRTNI
jgi:LysM repeat protein